MDQGTLVEMQVADGKRLIDRLLENGIGVTAAGWLKEAESGQWFLYIVTPLVGEDGATKAAYRRVNTVIRGLRKESFWIDPLEIKLIGPTDSIGRDLHGIPPRTPGPRVSTIPWGGKRLGNLSIEGAYLYPLPTPTAK
jgi:hypothetical protein